MEIKKGRYLLSVRAKPNSKEEKVEQLSNTDFVVSVKEPPIQGRANAAILKALANHFHTSLSNLRILSGHTSRQKVIEIF